MKAREIIAGWPRGRSTSSRRRWLELPVLDDIEYRAERWADIAYHRDQQIMVTRYFEKLYRRGICTL